MYPKPAHGKGIIHASVWDITSKPSPPPSSSPSTDGVDPARTFSLPEGVEPGTVDVLTVIYVLSALHPTEWDQAIHNLYSVSRAPLGSRCG
jgi:tRNAThr (cytosine32-N3)-methyltransferase